MRTLVDKAIVTFGDGRVFAGDAVRQATNEERELVEKSLAPAPDPNDVFNDLLVPWLACDALVIEKSATDEIDAEPEAEPEQHANNPFLAALSDDSLYYFAFKYLQPSAMGTPHAGHCLARSQDEAELKSKVLLAERGVNQAVAVRKIAVATIANLKQNRLWETLNILECTEVIANELIATQRLTTHIENVSKSIKQRTTSRAGLATLFDRSEAWESEQCTRVQNDANSILDSLFPF